MLPYYNILLYFLPSTYQSLKLFNSHISIFIACFFLYWNVDSMREKPCGFLFTEVFLGAKDGTCHIADGL